MFNFSLKNLSSFSNFCLGLKALLVFLFFLRLAILQLGVISRLQRLSVLPFLASISSSNLIFLSASAASSFPIALSFTPRVLDLAFMLFPNLKVACFKLVFVKDLCDPVDHLLSYLVALNGNLLYSFGCCYGEMLNRFHSVFQ